MQKFVNSTVNSVRYVDSSASEERHEEVAISDSPNYLKVLLLTDAFLPHSGGSREYYHNIYRELVGLGGTCVNILTKKVPGWEEFDRQVCSETYRIERRFRPLFTYSYKQLPKGVLPFVQALWRVLVSRPSVIHAGDLYPPGVTAMMLKTLLGIPYVVYCHGEEITQLDRYRVQPRVRNKIYLNADAVIANSEFTRQSLLHIGVPDRRIYKITPGVDSSRFKPLPADSGLKKQYGLEGKFVLLTVARLLPRKGHRLVLQALSKIASDIPQVHYLIVGEGQEEQALREMVEDLRLSGHVTFAGHVPACDLPRLYNLCDVMIVANRQEGDGDIEGFGMVFLEASAVGKPVIGGRTGGAAEAIVDRTTGYLVDPDNACELADLLRRLLLDRDLCEKLGSAGLRRVRSEFNWRTRAVLLRKINLEIAGQRDESGKNRVA